MTQFPPATLTTLTITRHCPHCQANNIYDLEKILSSPPISSSVSVRDTASTLSPQILENATEYLVVCGECKREYLIAITENQDHNNKQQLLARRLPEGEARQRTELSSQYNTWEQGMLANIEAAARAIFILSAALIGLIFASSLLGGEIGTLSHWPIKFWGILFLLGQSAAAILSLAVIWPQTPTIEQWEPNQVRAALQTIIRRKRVFLFGALISSGISVGILTLVSGAILLAK